LSVTYAHFTVEVAEDTELEATVQYRLTDTLPETVDLKFGRFQSIYQLSIYLQDTKRYYSETHLNQDQT